MTRNVTYVCDDCNQQKVTRMLQMCQIYVTGVLSRIHRDLSPIWDRMLQNLSHILSIFTITLHIYRSLFGGLGLKDTSVQIVDLMFIKNMFTKLKSLVSDQVIIKRSGTAQVFSQWVLQAGSPMLVGSCLRINFKSLSQAENHQLLLVLLQA